MKLLMLKVIMLKFYSSVHCYIVTEKKLLSLWEYEPISTVFKTNADKAQDS